MKADRADYPDSMQVRVNVKSVFEHKTQQFLTSISRCTVAKVTAKYIILHDVLVKCALLRDAGGKHRLYGNSFQASILVRLQVATEVSVSEALRLMSNNTELSHVFIYLLSEITQK